jgi:bifunctional UDP-N-acetylglucosamine pyrophosphorylase / glucosamine-1-phosphate N-acetyltransferase
MSPGEGRPLTVVVLAAGLGKRMKSRTVKLLHAVWGRPMVARVLDALAGFGPQRLILVLGHQAEQVREALADWEFESVVQAEQLGTGHAVMTARPLFERGDGNLLILNGDLPLLTQRTLIEFVAAHERAGAVFSLLTTVLDEPAGYGRVVRGEGGRVARLVEDRDATPDERRLREINCGVYLASIAELLPCLDRLVPANAQGEYYLTDVVADLVARGKNVQGIPHGDPREVLGVNTRAELAGVTALLTRRKLDDLMTEGVTLIDPDHTWVDPRARIGRDSVLYPGVLIEGGTVLGEGCVVGPHAHLIEVRAGDGVVIKDGCRVERSELRDGAQVGPFAHLRPGTYLSERVRIGNFVETKKAFLGPGSKANHLSYLGDAEIGRDVNVGAGTITCNYDGVAKHRTVLEDGVFIGSDTQLVAPVRVGAGSYVGAGSTVTRDVPAGSLAISRAPQKNIEGWVERKKRRPARPGGGPAGDAAPKE